MFIALVVVGLYFLPYFSSLGRIGAALIIPDWGAFLAAATFAVSFLSYLWAPKKHIAPLSLSAYLLLAATTATLIFTTGGPFSTFISLWLLVAVFASVFGAYGIVPLFSAAVGYGIYLWLVYPDTPFEGFLIIGIVGTIPLVASYIIFHARSKGEDKHETAYNQLASELSEVSNKSDVVIGAIDDGVIAVDSKGVIELMNPAAQRIIGWGKSDAIGLDYHSVLKLTDKDDQATTNANDPILAVLTNNKDVHTKDFFVTTSSGKRLILSLVISPIGQLGQGAIIVFRDITKEESEEREQAEFISTASHEMRTPVASIEGYLGLALNPNTAQIDEKARDFIGKAHESAQHLGRLFQDLLDVSKAEDGRLSNHPAIVDVVEYVGDIVDGLRPKAEEKQLRVFYKPKPDGDAVENRVLSPVFYSNVDNDHLREVVANLVENAIKYTLKGDVVVDVTGDDDHVYISITDSGIGIPAEDISHLFQKFYRVDNSATREIGGTGLGLYLCRRLAEVMGGRISVESEFQKGSTFTLELPRTEREEAMRMIDAASSEISATSEQIAAQNPEQNSDDLIRSLQESGVPTSISSADSLPQDSYSSSIPNQNGPIDVNSDAMNLRQPAPQPPQMPSAPVAPPPQQPAASPPTLAAIEQNPSAYYQGRADTGLQVPNRDETTQNGPPSNM